MVPSEDCVPYMKRLGTCSLQGPHGLHLPEDGGEGVGDDGEDDDHGEQEDGEGGQDQLHVTQRHAPLTRQQRVLLDIQHLAL